MWLAFGNRAIQLAENFVDVGVETAKLKSVKLKSANIISPTTCNDVMHALALLAPVPSSALLREL